MGCCFFFVCFVFEIRLGRVLVLFRFLSVREGLSSSSFRGFFGWREVFFGVDVYFCFEFWCSGVLFCFLRIYCFSVRVYFIFRVGNFVL